MPARMARHVFSLIVAGASLVKLCGHNAGGAVIGVGNAAKHVISAAAHAKGGRCKRQQEKQISRADTFEHDEGQALDQETMYAHSDQSPSMMRQPSSTEQPAAASVCEAEEPSCGSGRNQFQGASSGPASDWASSDAGCSDSEAEGHIDDTDNEGRRDDEAEAQQLQEDTWKRPAGVPPLDMGPVRAQKWAEQFEEMCQAEARREEALKNPPASIEEQSQQQPAGPVLSHRVVYGHAESQQDEELHQRCLAQLQEASSSGGNDSSAAANCADSITRLFKRTAAARRGAEHFARQATVVQSVLQQRISAHELQIATLYSMVTGERLEYQDVAPAWVQVCNMLQEPHNIAYLDRWFPATNYQ